jgi:regulator of sirC expression with transglutaminase-like and TPR domain
MLSPTPLCCSPRAYTLLNSLRPSLNSPDGLLQGAVAIAMHQMDDIDPAAVDLTLQGYADTVRSRVRGSQTQAVLAHLHELLFEEEGFAGNSDDYYNPLNSYLPSVLQTKRGLPITLSLVYKIVAERLGLRVWGVALPGHFLIGMESGETRTLVDPFSGGRLLSEDEARDRLVQMFGPEAEWSDEMMQPASNRHWLTRMLQNLLNVFGNAGRYADVAAVLEMEMLLWPDQNHLQRDLGLVLARCGLAQPASVWLDRYLKTNPDDPQRTQIRELLQVLSN